MIGNRVTTPVKGNLYIINGKKVVLKQPFLTLKASKPSHRSDDGRAFHEKHPQPFDSFRFSSSKNNKSLFFLRFQN